MRPDLEVLLGVSGVAWVYLFGIIIIPEFLEARHIESSLKNIAISQVICLLLFGVVAFPLNALFGSMSVLVLVVALTIIAAVGSVLVLRRPINFKNGND
jgi:NhaP-type Na+/H+ and K+/H+ antiporter